MGDENSSMAVMESSATSMRPANDKLSQFLSTAEAARMLGLSTTLVQTLVDQGELKGGKHAVDTAASRWNPSWTTRTPHAARWVLRSNP